MKKLSLFLLFLISLSQPAFSHMKKDAMSMHDAKGGCSKYKQTLAKELAAWKLSAGSLDGFAIPVGKKIKFLLMPEDSIVLPVEPQIVYPSHGFKADLTFKAPKSGTYRMSLGAHYWISIYLRNGKELQPSHIEMQSSCGVIKKFLEVPLEADTEYLIHVSNSKKDSQELLLTETGK